MELGLQYHFLKGLISILLVVEKLKPQMDFHQMDILFLVRKTNNYPPKNNRPTAASLSKSLPWPAKTTLPDVNT